MTNLFASTVILGMVFFLIGIAIYHPDLDALT